MPLTENSATSALTPMRQYVFHILVPVARSIIKRDGSLLPGYATARVHHSLEGVMVLSRRLQPKEPIQYFKHWSARTPSYKAVEATCAGQERILVLFENDELLVSGDQGRLFVRRPSPVAAAAFRDPYFHHRDFWTRVNPHLDSPFVDPKDSWYSPLRCAESIDPVNWEPVMRNLCESILRLMLPDDGSASLLIMCGTREYPASAQLMYRPRSSPRGAASAAGELAARLVEIVQPFSEALRSHAQAAWSSQSDARWRGARYRYDRAPMDTHGNGITPIERAMKLGKLRSQLTAIGVPCDDLLGQVIGA